MPFVTANPEGNLNQFPWPHYQGEGSAVASLANAIAALKQKQTENFQETLAQSIKEMADERAANAALDTAIATPGMPNPGTLQGTGKSGLAAYIAMMKANPSDPYRDAYYQAQADYLNRDKPLAGGAGRSGRATRIEDPDNPGQFLTTTQLYNRRKSQAALYGTQAEAIQKEGVTAPMAHGYVMKDGKMVYAATPEEQAHPELVSPGDPLDTTTTPVDPKAAPPPIFTSQYQQQRSAERQKLLDQQKAIQDKMLNTAPDAGDQGGGGGGPHDQAISQANQIKADFQAGKITADQAKAQIQALQIPGLQ